MRHNADSVPNAVSVWGTRQNLINFTVINIPYFVKTKIIFLFYKINPYIYILIQKI